jgi:hypothetical protein
VYLDAENSDSLGNTSVLRITDGTTTYYLNDPKGHTYQLPYEEATSTDASAPGKGNFVVFRGLTGDLAKIRIETVGGGANKPVVSAIQIRGTSWPIDTVATDEASGGGDDRIFTGSGVDLVMGGAGNDIITTYGGNSLGATDSDLVIGDNGFATLITRNGDLDVRSLQATGTTGGNDTIKTGNGDDLVLGGLGNDTIDAGSQVLTDAAGVKVLGFDFSNGGDRLVTGSAGAVRAGNWNNITAQKRANRPASRPSSPSTAT